MPCVTGDKAEDCAIEHWCHPLRGFREGKGWRAPCPLGHGDNRVLSFWIERQSIRWCCHHADCDRRSAHRALVKLVGGCVPGYRDRTRPAADIEAATALLYDKSLPPNALRLVVLRALGQTEKEIRDGLKLPRQTFSDAVRVLGQTRRSADAENSDTPVPARK